MVCPTTGAIDGALLPGTSPESPRKTKEIPITGLAKSVLLCRACEWPEENMTKMNRNCKSLSRPFVAAILLAAASPALAQDQTPARTPEPPNAPALATYAVAPGTRFLVKLDDNLTTRKPEENKKFKATTLEPLRSEEHTSELQSLRHLVCRLLLEK